MDTSLSMTGKKLAITAIALAVLCLQVPEENLSVIVFNSEATILKKFGEKIPIIDFIEKFLEVPTRGLTNIEAALDKANKELKRATSSTRSCILITDGKHTAGKNPESSAKKLPRLHIIQMGNTWSSPRFCRNLAHAGKGKFLRAMNIEDLPKSLYTLSNYLVR
ncbi:MAG: VWA domain-containing protein [Oligoflexia bacterium]|nr:VWA domain-containing protein [Oligoflexia bacterium]